jgi:sec-independent protein translocase protein TatC
VLKLAEQVDSFWGHFAELAKRMKKVLLTFLVSTVVMLILPANTDFLAITSNYQPLVSVFINEARSLTLPANVKLIAIQISDPISLYVIAAVLFGLVITMPVFALEVYKFVDPALYTHEKKAVYPFIIVVTELFIFGAIFGFFFLFPTFIAAMFPFFYAVGAELMLSLMDFYTMLFFTIIISGFLFTIPAFFLLLVKFNVINTAMFKRKRKWIYLGILVVALFVSPSASPQGDLILGIALAVLFEASIFAGKIIEHRKKNNSEPKLASWFSSSPTICNFCNSKADSSKTVFCPNCKRSLK